MPVTDSNCKIDTFVVTYSGPKLAVQTWGVHFMDREPGDVLTIEELAAYLKISKSTLYKIVREGKIPSQKVGRHWRFRKVAIDRWLDETRGNNSELGGDR